MTAVQGNKALEMWVIYDSPSDLPDLFVVRRWVLGPGTTEPDPEPFGTASTLDGARDLLHPGLIRMERSPDDDPVIVEVWL